MSACLLQARLPKSVAPGGRGAQPDGAWRGSLTSDDVRQIGRQARSLTARYRS